MLSLYERGSVMYVEDLSCERPYYEEGHVMSETLLCERLCHVRCSVR